MKLTPEWRKKSEKNRKVCMSRLAAALRNCGGGGVRVKDLYSGQLDHFIRLSLRGKLCIPRTAQYLKLNRNNFGYFEQTHTVFDVILDELNQCFSTGRSRPISDNLLWVAKPIISWLYGSPNCIYSVLWVAYH